MELEKSAEQVLPENKGEEGEKVEARGRGENDPNNVCTCE
jgi:hypothetical protein